MIEQYAEFIVRLLVSLVLGASVGLERELRETAAGLRTHTLVCIGAAIFTIVSIMISGPNVDISRIAGQVVVGIGFIGGGVVFKSEKKVTGLTTAASLWVAAALGLLAGIGEYMLGCIAMLLTLLVLVGGRYVEIIILHKKKKA